MTITPRKWVPVTLISLLFEPAIDVNNTNLSKILEKYRKSHENFGKIAKKARKFIKIEQNLGKTGKVDFNEGKGAPFTPITPMIPHDTPITPMISGTLMTTYNTHHSKNHEKARQKLPITPIIRKVVGCYSHPSLYFYSIFKL